MERGVNRGEIWWAQVGGKRRPVLVLTRDEVLDVRALVTVAEVTTTLRGLATEVPIDWETLGLDQESTVNTDGIHTVAKTVLTDPIGVVDRTTLERVCEAVGYALGC